MIKKLSRVIARACGKPIDQKKLMANGIVLCPKEEVSCPKAIYIDSHLLRVKGASIYSSMEVENINLHNTLAVHEPTVLYSIGSTNLFSGGLWTDKREYSIRLLSQEDQRFKVDLDQAVLVDSDLSNHFFGHWLHDVVPSTLIGTVEMPSLAFKKPKYPHADDYQSILNLDIIYGNKGRVKNLFFLNDFSQNSHKAKRYMQVRSLIKEKLNPQDSPYSGVYIARGSAGAKRMLTNESALIEHLARRGFDIVCPEKITAETLIRQLWNAPIIVSVEGSALAHPIYSIAQNGAYLVLQPPFRVSHTHKGMCDAMNRPYGFYVCQPSDDEGSFYVDSMMEIDRLIDQLENEKIKRKFINN